jgi:hypothetical protein
MLFSGFDKTGQEVNCAEVAAFLCFYNGWRSQTSRNGGF